MIKPIMQDPLFLMRKSVPATRADLAVADDLLDTLFANRKRCVGLAANMIGVSKRIIVLDDEGAHMVMFNPEIIRQSEPFEAEEGCLSLTGVRKTTRYKTIEVQYQDRRFRTHTRTFTGWTAQIIQHEIDHCNGILI